MSWIILPILKKKGHPMIHTNGYAKPGFSLLELMAYFAIVMVLVGGAAVVIRNMQHNAKVRSTETALNLVKNAIDGYHARNDEYPATLNDLKPRELKDIPKDGWGNPLKYKVTENGKHPYELDSYGSEGPGGSERISGWTK